MKALIVGGEKKYVNSTIKKNLLSMGIEVVGFHGGLGKSKPLNGVGDAKIVILMADTCNHLQSNNAKDAAEANGIMFVSTSRKWAQMKPAITTVLGHNGYSLHDLTKAADTGKSKVEEEEIQPPVEARKDHAREAVKMVLEERPELVLDFPAAEYRASILVENEEGFSLQQIVLEEARKLKAGWTKMGQVGGSSSSERVEEREKLLKLKLGWLRRWLPEQDVLPVNKDIQSRCKDIFGGTVPFEDIRGVMLELIKAYPAPAPELRVEVQGHHEAQFVRMPPDLKEFQRMLKLWNTCSELEVDIHHTAAEYFSKYYDGKPPPEEDGIEILKTYDTSEPVLVSSIPSISTHLRFV